MSTRVSDTFLSLIQNIILEEEENHDRTGKPVVCPQRGAQQFVTGDDETESDLSL